jgi:hypothetical protein
MWVYVLDEDDHEDDCILFIAALFLGPFAFDLSALGCSSTATWRHRKRFSLCPTPVEFAGLWAIRRSTFLSLSCSLILNFILYTNSITFRFNSLFNTISYSQIAADVIAVSVWSLVRNEKAAPFVWFAYFTLPAILQPRTFRKEHLLPRAGQTLAYTNEVELKVSLWNDWSLYPIAPGFKTDVAKLKKTLFGSSR